MTKLEKLVERKLGIPLSEITSAEQRAALQVKLDLLTPEIVSLFKPGDLLRNNKKVYDATASQYAANPHNRGVIPEIVDFILMIKRGSLVLDIGCGPGRDTLFMATTSQKFRLEQLRLRLPWEKRKSHSEKSFNLQFLKNISFRTVGVDAAPAMLYKASNRFLFLADDGHGYPFPIVPEWRVADMHQPTKLLKEFKGEANGIWSCAALFTHTPRPLLEKSLKNITALLKPDGVFFASYTRGEKDRPYDKLLLSGTGRIKYFSHPDPDEIAGLAEKAGLKITKYGSSDPLFVSQFFKKRSPQRYASL